MRRSGTCRTCGATIRPTAKDMSVGAASRRHYWTHHPELMLGRKADKRWDEDAAAAKPRTRRRKRDP